MSGPKVVRIVTREELEAICRGYLQLVDDAVEELKRCARRHEVLDETLTTGLKQRRAALKQMFARERWSDLQKQAQQDVSFLKSELDRIRAQAVAAAEAARSKRRRTEEAARTLISAFEASGREPPRNLLDVASTALSVDESALAGMQSVLNDALRQLTPTSTQTGLSAAQRELAGRLGAGESGRSLTEWLASQPAGSNERDARLEPLLAELEALDEAEAARPFLARATAISAEPSSSRRALLTDSLVLDVAAHCKARREREATAAKLQELRSELIALGSPAARDLGNRISEALESDRLDGAEALFRGARERLEAERRELAAAARRQAVLGGLAELGYEVRESMATAWSKNGRLVVRKPGSMDYGVELGAPADAAKMQVRLVGSDRPSSARDAHRDRDMETSWCTEFQQLRELLTERGTDVVMERALEPGAKHVKTVTFESSGADEREEIARTPGLRTLR
jgi:hypothetical protein